MATYEGIGEVSESFRLLLERGLAILTPAPPAVALNDFLQPIAPAPLVTVFLYDVVEDATVRNASPARELDTATGAELLRRAPTPLMLRYLVAAWNDDPIAHHTVIGRIAQILHDNAIISGLDLVGSLQRGNEAIRIRMLALDLEERARIWHAVQRPYRLSLYCELRVVRLQSDAARAITPVIASETRQRLPTEARS